MRLREARIHLEKVGGGQRQLPDEAGRCHRGDGRGKGKGKGQGEGQEGARGRIEQQCRLPAVLITCRFSLLRSGVGIAFTRIDKRQSFMADNCTTN